MRYANAVSRYEREESPVLDRCPVCGCEIYDRYELDMYDGLCAECYRSITEAGEDAEDD